MRDCSRSEQSEQKRIKCVGSEEHYPETIPPLRVLSGWVFKEYALFGAFKLVLPPLLTLAAHQAYS